MKKYILLVLLAAVTTISMGMAGCPLQTRDQVDQQRTQQDSVTSGQKKGVQAPPPAPEIDVDSEIRTLTGRVEVVENKVEQAERDRKSQPDQASENNKKISLIQEELAKIEGQLNHLTEDVVALQQNAQQQQQPTVISKKNSESKSVAFNEAEDDFDKKEWKKAILHYQKFRDASPKDKKIPEATYKIGVCFQELGMKDEAKTFYDDLISKYPETKEAKKAKIREKSLKK